MMKPLLCTLLIFSSIAWAKDRILLSEGSVVCYPTSNTFAMRDANSACGRNTHFCTTPLDCYRRNTGKYIGGGIVTCRTETFARLDDSNKNATREITESCPSLQDCADDTRQDLVDERDLWHWSESGSPRKCIQGNFCGTTITGDIHD